MKNRSQRCIAQIEKKKGESVRKMDEDEDKRREYKGKCEANKAQTKISEKELQRRIENHKMKKPQTRFY